MKKDEEDLYKLCMPFEPSLKEKEKVLKKLNREFEKREKHILS